MMLKLKSWMPHLCPNTIECAICRYGWEKRKKEKEDADEQ